jgi:hypothetical protein
MIANWVDLPSYKIAAIQFNLIDRLYLILEIAKQYSDPSNIYFWNPSYDYLQKVEITENIVTFRNTDYLVEGKITVVGEKISSPGILIFEGSGRIDPKLNYELRNYYFRAEAKHQVILADSTVSIPVELYAMIAVLDFGIPDLESIDLLIDEPSTNDLNQSLVQACYGLPRGEIEFLIQDCLPSKSLVEKITNFKTLKLAARGLKIVPKPDVRAGGLDLLDQDLEKIKKLFSQEAKNRNLRPPKGCCLWGLPGTGKSLVAKMMSEKLNATLIACDWNQLLDNNLTQSLANLEYVLEVVDGIGNCVLFFDEFEKAFTGWNSNSNGGILAKMAGKLLTWMQDHDSPSIMLATINHLDMLPPELIRRFNYIWFFPSELHDGAQWEIFQLHLIKHFPGFHEQFTDTQWRTLFMHYRGCSPAEIAGAVERSHHEIFYLELHHNLTPETLLEELYAERTRFKPASTNKTTSNALAKILMEADFARPVRGMDTSRFARLPRGLFEKDPDPDKSKVSYDEYEEIYHQIVQVSGQPLF